MGRVTRMGSHIFGFWGNKILLSRDSHEMVLVKKFRKLLFIKCNNHLALLSVIVNHNFNINQLHN